MKESIERTSDMEQEDQNLGSEPSLSFFEKFRSSLGIERYDDVVEQIEAGEVQEVDDFTAGDIIKDVKDEISEGTNEISEEIDEVEERIGSNEDVEGLRDVLDEVERRYDEIFENIQRGVQSENSLEEVQATAQEELGGSLEELESLIDEAEDLSIELPDHLQEFDSIQNEIEKLRNIVGEARQKLQNKAEFFQSQDLTEEEERQRLDELLESGIRISQLKKEGVNAGIVTQRLQDLLKERDFDLETKSNIFELYSNVSKPLDALKLAKKADIRIDEETIEELKRAAVILQPFQVVQRRFDFELEEAVIEEFGGDYTLTKKQRKILAEIAPYYFKKDSPQYKYIIEQDQKEPNIPLEDVEINHSSFLDNLETSEEISFSSIDIITDELSERQLFENYSPDQVPEGVGPMQHKDLMESGSLNVEDTEEYVDSAIEQWMSKKKRRFQRYIEFPYEIGRDVPKLKQEHLGALEKKLSQEWPEKGEDLLRYYISVADQTLKRLDDVEDWSESEKKWLYVEVIKPFMGLIIKKESEDYNEEFNKKIESKTVDSLSKFFPEISDILEERRNSYEVKMASPVLDPLMKKGSFGQYDAHSNRIKIRRKTSGARTPTHELIHALSQGKSEEAIFMDDDGEHTSFCNGLTEAVVDSCTKLLTGGHTYKFEVKQLQELRFWTFSSPSLREYKTPEPMEDENLSLNFFVKALFDEKKSLKNALKEKGFDKKDRQIFIEVARELFDKHEVKGF